MLAVSIYEPANYNFRSSTEVYSVNIHRQMFSGGATEWQQSVSDQLHTVIWTNYRNTEGTNLAQQEVSR